MMRPTLFLRAVTAALALLPFDVHAGGSGPV